MTETNVTLSGCFDTKKEGAIGVTFPVPIVMLNTGISIQSSKLTGVKMRLVSVYHL